MMNKFVYVNIMLKIRWTSSDYRFYYLSQNGLREKDFNVIFISQHFDWVLFVISECDWMNNF